MLFYLSAPYSQVQDKQKLMDELYKCSFIIMENLNFHIISPLFLHPGLHLRPDFGTDYAFWKNYCEKMLAKCDAIIVYEPEGINISKSVGVLSEIYLAKSLGKPQFTVDSFGKINELSTRQFTPG